MQGKRIAGKSVEDQFFGPRPGIFGKTALILLVSVAVLVVGAVVGMGIYANTIYKGIFPGVSVEGISLEGQDLAGAKATIDQQLTQRLESAVMTVTADGETLGSFDQAQLGARYHAEEAVEKACAVGRESGFGGWFRNAFAMTRAILGNKVEFSASLIHDEETIRAAAEQLAKDFDKDSADAFYELTDDGVYATKERNGRVLDSEALAKLMLGAEGEIEAPWAKIPGQTLDLEAMADEICSEALPTRYDIATGTVLEGQTGVEVDIEASEYVLAAADEGERVKLPGRVTHPEMTAAELEAVLFRDLLSTASTSVSGTKARKGNVKLSAEFVHGTILNPGDVFDYNAIVGERTKERGFGEASAYRNGETVQEIGGGICQTSSTVYYAALLANLEITERANHRFYPGYIELGMDATVSWGGPEFRFRNDTAYPIRIEVIYEKDTLTVKIYGTKTDDTYVVMTHEVTSTTPYNTVYEETMRLMWGTEQVKQSGYTGYKVISYRNVYDGDGNLISSEVEAKSNYFSRDKIVLVGINGRPQGGSVETGGEVDPGTDPGSDPGNTPGNEPGGPGSGEEEEDPGMIDPEDEMPEWLRPH